MQKVRFQEQAKKRGREAGGAVRAGGRGLPQVFGRSFTYVSGEDVDLMR